MAMTVPASPPTTRPVTTRAAPTIAAALPSFGSMRAAEALSVSGAWSSAEKPRWVAASVGAREVAGAATAAGLGACPAAGCETANARTTAPAAKDQGDRSIVVLHVVMVTCYVILVTCYVILVTYCRWCVVLPRLSYFGSPSMRWSFSSSMRPTYFLIWGLVEPQPFHSHSGARAWTPALAVVRSLTLIAGCGDF